MKDELKGKIVATLFGIAVSVLLIEAFFYFAPNFLPHNVRFVSTSIFDDDLRQYFKPNIDTIQKLDDGVVWNLKTTNLGLGGVGFRDDGVESSEIYAVVVGDSHVYGHGVDLDNVWTEVLETKTGAEVVNMGQPAAFPATQLKILERYGAQVKPKVVLFSIFQNDWADAASFEREKEGFTFVKRFMDSYSSTYRLARFVYNINNYNENYGYPLYSQGDVEYYLYPFHMGGVVNESDEGIRYGRDSVRASVIEASEFASSNNMSIVFVIFPSKEQVYWDEIKEIAPDPGININNLNEDIASLCEDNNLTCVDLLPSFVENKERQLFFKLDGHPNAEAEKIAAEQVYAVLAKESLLP